MQDKGIRREPLRFYFVSVVIFSRVSVLAGQNKIEPPDQRPDRSSRRDVFRGNQSESADLARSNFRFN